MLTVECDRWNEKASDLREEALKAKHIRTRERLMALYEICNGKSATKVGKQTGRNPQTIMDWVHLYNSSGMLRCYIKEHSAIPLFFPRNRRSD